MGLLIGLHVIVCVLLIIIILIQAGRGGGLVEGFSGVESMFGPKTNSFLTRTTTVLSSLFLITCISLAFLSVRQNKSLMRNVPVKQPVANTLPETKTQQPKETTSAVKTETPQTQEQKLPAQTQSATQPDTTKQEIPKGN